MVKFTIRWPCDRQSRAKLMKSADHCCRKGITRLYYSLCENEMVRFTCMIFTLGCCCCAFLLWLFIRDPCSKYSITKALCQEYKNGLAAGRMCYNLCYEETIHLSCLAEDEETSTFGWIDTIVKASKPTKKFNDLSEPSSSAVWEGMTLDDFVKKLEDFFFVQLGPGDHSMLIDRVLNFADFNGDAEFSFGEINSMWKLLHKPEFLTILIFSKHPVFPYLNDTCSDMYAYEHIKTPVLYDKSDTSWFSRIFSDSYRWNFPPWLRRVQISVGLLEFISVALEEANTRFYMCNLSPTKFGFTNTFQMKVTSLHGITSEEKLKFALSQKKCLTDSDCVIGQICHSDCDINRQECSKNILSLDIVEVCRILVDYIFFDAPSKIKAMLKIFVSKCSSLHYGHNSYNNSQVDINHNLLIDDLITILWDQIKDQSSKWFKNEPIKMH
ncbi:hypothetical protein CHS0354_001329 [Potamilus streckersoni]|uniref:Uncharacterized protein n=1 Tax=Potamilus streckersoni TaxID=2493646 RepID=A0AAE0RV14_9BIVA|nr:hypothetical protein CHS0354_001329 [Potamilus streckersoni]